MLGLSEKRSASELFPIRFMVDFCLLKAFSSVSFSPATQHENPIVLIRHSVRWRLCAQLFILLRGSKQIRLERNLLSAAIANAKLIETTGAKKRENMLYEFYTTLFIKYVFIMMFMQTTLLHSTRLLFGNCQHKFVVFFFLHAMQNWLWGGRPDTL